MNCIDTRRTAQIQQLVDICQGHSASRNVLFCEQYFFLKHFGFFEVLILIFVELAEWADCVQNKDQRYQFLYRNNCLLLAPPSVVN